MRAIATITTALTLLATSTTFAATAPKKPTYTKDIAPIFQANCVGCHRPNDIGAMSLMTYDEVRPWAKSIAKVIDQRTMPPWHADKGIGEFVNDRSLDEVEVETILNWVKRGAKEGDPSDMPPPLTFDDAGWRLGTPDLVVEFEQVDLDAGGPDQFFDLVGETGLTEDTWLESVEVLPSNRKVTHHVIIWQGAQDGQRGWVGAWAAGMEPMEFPDGTGRLLAAGTSLVGDMHYHPADTPQSDQTRLGLYFAEDNAVEKELVNLWVQNGGFEIPAGNPNYAARATYTFTQDAYITAMLPHLHYRGKDFSYTARFPDGRKEQLLKVSNYDFNWQTGYNLEEPLFVPEGTRIDCIAHWDNSAENPNNPDPTKNVRFGNESYDEMMIGFIDYYVKDGVSPMSADELAQLQAAALNTQHPGEVYFLTIDQSGGADIPGVAYIPNDGSNGVWQVSIQGSPFEIPLTDVSWTGNEFNCTAEVLGQTFNVSGSVNAATGEVTGKLAELIDLENTAPITGKKVQH